MLSLSCLSRVSRGTRTLAQQEILARCPSFEAFWRQHLGETPPFPPSSDLLISGTAVTHWLLYNKQPARVYMEIWGTRDQIDDWCIGGARTALCATSLYITSRSPSSSTSNPRASRWHGSTWVYEVLSFEDIVCDGKTVILEVLIVKDNPFAALLASTHSVYISFPLCDTHF